MGDTLVNIVTKRTGVTGIVAPSIKKLRIDSDHLFQGNSEIVIVHQEEEYNLRITRNGKLILTK
jgi:hemin uptake protein HemP